MKISELIEGVEYEREIKDWKYRIVDGDIQGKYRYENWRILSRPYNDFLEMDFEEIDTSITFQELLELVSGGNYVLFTCEHEYILTITPKLAQKPTTLDDFLRMVGKEVCSSFVAKLLKDGKFTIVEE